MTIDTRPPLRLTASEARNWMSLHSEDIGREIIIVGSPVLDSPPKYVEVRRHFARWEYGLGGDWPTFTIFNERDLEHPPRLFTVTGGLVTIQGVGETATYGLWSPPYTPELALLEGQRPATLGKVTRR